MFYASFDVLPTAETEISKLEICMYSVTYYSSECLWQGGNQGDWETSTVHQYNFGLITVG